MKELGIGLLGFGTVGAGVIEGLRRNGDLIATRLGARLAVRAIADLDLERDRGVAVERALLTTDAAGVVARPDIDIVVELIGGTGAARSLTTAALARGKPVVTANKSLLAKHGAELFALAAEQRADLAFGASVGGGIPVIRALRDGLMANRIESIYGILNGTCNYILTRMETEGLTFKRALNEAQEKGYAEADPSLDIDGHDTAHKAVILASLAHGFPVPLEQVSVEGIRTISDQDMRYAQDLGYRIKLLAIVKSAEAGLDVRVHPTLLSRQHMLASVSGVFNAVMIKGDLTGQSLLYGRGAGREPTAATVIADLADVARNLLSGARRVPALPGAGAARPLVPLSDIAARYYLRLSLLDRPGVLARVTAILGRHGVSLASILQKETKAGDYVPVVIVTHETPERAMQAAAEEIDRLDAVNRKTVRLRIED